MTRRKPPACRKSLTNLSHNVVHLSLNSQHQLPYDITATTNTGDKLQDLGEFVFI
jgi:hypothetical protein